MLEQAIQRVTQTPTRILVACMTGQGEHAKEQVIAFSVQNNLSMQKLQRGINFFLPKTIRIIYLEKVLPTFHPARDSIFQEYHYYINTQPIHNPFQKKYVWNLQRPLNIVAMKRSVHNFLHKKEKFNLCKQKGTCLKKNDNQPGIIYHMIVEKKEFVRLIFIGNHISHKIRDMINCLVHIGICTPRGKHLPLLLSNEKLQHLPVSAPPHALFLKKVYYP